MMNEADKAIKVGNVVCVSFEQTPVEWNRSPIPLKRPKLKPAKFGLRFVDTAAFLEAAIARSTTKVRSNKEKRETMSKTGSVIEAALNKMDAERPVRTDAQQAAYAFKRSEEALKSKDPLDHIDAADEHLEAARRFREVGDVNAAAAHATEAKRRTRSWRDLNKQWRELAQQQVG